MAGANPARAATSCKEQWSPLIASQKYLPQKQEPYAGYAARTARASCQKEWTVLVYMAADNDLTPYALWDLYEMESSFRAGTPMAGSTLNTDVVVQLDTARNSGIRRLHMFEGSRPFQKLKREDFERMTEDDIESPVVARFSEENSPSEARKLQDFLLWGVRNYPARHYLVIVWGHGQGWTSQKPRIRARGRYLSPADVALLPEVPGTEAFPPAESRRFPDDKVFGGLALDYSNQTYLDIPALGRVLENVAQAIGRPLDVLATDACLMQSVEVLSEFGAGARYVIGSNQVQNFLGLPYRRLFYLMNQGQFSRDGDQAYALARAIPSIMKKSMDPRAGSQGKIDPEGSRFLLMSSVNTSEMNRYLVPSLQSLGAALERYLLEDPGRRIDLQFLIQSTPAFGGGTQDLGFFLGLLELQLQEEAERNGNRVSPGAMALHEQVSATAQALQRSVLSSVYGTDYGVDEISKRVWMIPRGVSVWLPQSAEEYRGRLKDFSKSGLYRAQPQKWRQWLRALYEQ